MSRKVKAAVKKSSTKRVKLGCEVREAGRAVFIGLSGGKVVSPIAGTPRGKFAGADVVGTFGVVEGVDAGVVGLGGGDLSRPDLFAVDHAVDLLVAGTQSGLFVSMLAGELAGGAGVSGVGELFE